MPGMTFDQFKQCCKIQENLDMEAWDVALIQPLKDISAWWQSQSDFTKKYATWLGSIGGTALTVVLGKIANISAAEVASTFATLLAAVLAGLVVGTFMDILGRCSIQEVEQLVA
jgi:hypothetical protein